MTDTSDPPEQAAPLGEETVRPQPQPPLRAQPASPPQPTIDVGWDRTHTVAGAPVAGGPAAGTPVADRAMPDSAVADRAVPGSAVAGSPGRGGLTTGETVPSGPAGGSPVAGGPAWGSPVAGGLAGGSPLAGGPPEGGGSAGGAQIRRYGPGVPGAAAAAQAAMSADQVWQLGPPSGVPVRRRRWSWRLGSTLVSAALVIASVVVIVVRLHHPAFGVTGAAITGQARSGCAVDVTARVATTGGAGTLSYEWAFTPQGGTPQPATQAVAAGQTAVYLTAAVQGQGHGTLQQQVTLRVLSPGTASAAASVSLSC